MKTSASTLLLGVTLLCGAAHFSCAAEAPLPKRDLTVELRQTEDGREGGSSYSAGSSDNSLWEPQLVQVRNGEKALLRMNDAIPMQWTQSASGPAPAAGQAAASTNSTNAGSSSTVNINAASSVSKALVWFDAGQSISVRPKWPGGNKPALVEIEVQRAAEEPRTDADLPQQTRNSVSTTLTVPLAEWVTIAATGKPPRAGVYSSESGLQKRRLLQLRVMAP